MPSFISDSYKKACMKQVPFEVIFQLLSFKYLKEEYSITKYSFKFYLKKNSMLNLYGRKGISPSKILCVVDLTFMSCARPLLTMSSASSTFFIPVIPSTLLTPPTALSMSSSSVDMPLSEQPSLTPLSVSVLLGESPFRLASSSAPFLVQ